MFRRKANFKPFANLKKSDRKKLVNRVCEQYLSGVDVGNVAKDLIAAKDIRSAKATLHAGDQVVVYTDTDAKPLWIDFKNIVVPTVFAAWEAPFLLPLVVTVPYTVEQLQNGAHLMIPGIFEPLPDKAPAGTVVGISLTSSPNVPVAVGITLLDCSNGVLDTTSKGRAVQVVNIIEDTLWESFKGNKSIPEDLDRTIPEDDEANEEENENESVVHREKEEASAAVGPLAESLDSSTLDGNVEGGKAESDDDGGEGDRDGQTKLSNNGSESLSVQDVDEAFRMALLQTIKKAVDSPLDLPMPSSTFMSNYVLANLPFQHPGIQIKKSSWKKAAKFFKVVEKEGLVKYRERGGEIVILSLAGPDHVAIRNFQIYKVKQAKKPSTGSNQDGEVNIAKLIGLELYRPRSMNAPLFSAVGLSASGVYSAGTLRDVLNKYITDRSLVDKSKKNMVVLDDVLIKALGLPASQQTLGRDKMVPTLAASCSPFHIIAPEGQEGNMKPAKGPVPKIVIATERRGGHKVVTLISGLEPFHIDPDTFFEKLRVACAGSGSVNQIRSDSDLKVVMIQGNQATQVTKLLEKQGIRSGWIDVKTKK